LRLCPDLQASDCPPPHSPVRLGDGGRTPRPLAAQSRACGCSRCVSQPTLVPALPRTGRCSRPGRQEFALSRWQQMKSAGHGLCLCTLRWGKRGEGRAQRREGAELWSGSSSLFSIPFFFSPSQRVKTVFIPLFLQRGPWRFILPPPTIIPPGSRPWCSAQVVGTAAAVALPKASALQPRPLASPTDPTVQCVNALVFSQWESG